jgi:hypothetical protein
VNKPLQLIAMLILVALVAAATCYVSARVFGPLRPQSGASGDEWIHKQLGLSPEEHKTLEPIESKFTERKRNLLGEIRSANKELAEAMVGNTAQSYGSRCRASVSWSLPSRKSHSRYLIARL